jgi:signal recognition particle subunit SRP54
MFDSLSDRLGEVFTRLGKRGSLKESDVTAALREVRVALLEADVALPVVKDFIAAVGERAVGEEVLRSITPSQMVVKIVNDQLTKALGATASALDLAVTPPATILMVGLQGSGKTTTSAKLGLWLTDKEKKKVLLVSADTQRPAAQEQLQTLAGQAGLRFLSVIKGEKPQEIAGRALVTARLEGFDVVILDTAGRLHVDDALMDEAARLRDIVNPAETLLVADAMIGQDAVNVAKQFDERIKLTGIVLTRVDGDARGGAALSARAVTGCPIKLIGVGERLDALEEFHPERIASRILGMGDVVSLVEKAAETIEVEEAEKLAAKMKKGAFDFNDMRAQLRQVGKMGGIESMLGMLPGAGRMKAQLAGQQVDGRILVTQAAIIDSMTAAERRNAKLLNASRKRRIAQGSGTTIQEINRLIKQYKDTNRMMKKITKMGKKGLMRHGMAGLLPH